MANLNIRTEPNSLSPEYSYEPFQAMRDLLRWDPFAELARINTERMTFTPSFDVRETNDAFVLTADVPGLTEKDLEINLTNNRLTVSGKREHEKEEKGETWYRSERSYGSFSRTFTLPAEIDANKVTAEMKNGVLTIQLPRVANVQPKKIAVKPATNVKA